MIEIKPIEPYQIAEAKNVILSVARNLYQWEAPIEDLLNRFDQSGELEDIDHYQTWYTGRRGLLLVVVDRGRVGGTGGVTRVDDKICELKRLWLLEAYQGKGLGYRLLQELIAFGRAHGFSKIRLETDYEQERAIRFYTQAGFKPADKYNHRNSDLYMEMPI